MKRPDYSQETGFPQTPKEGELQRLTLFHYNCFQKYASITNLPRVLSLCRAGQNLCLFAFVWIWLKGPLLKHFKNGEIVPKLSRGRSDVTLEAEFVKFVLIPIIAQ